jgi:hypothetical protein
MILTIGDSFTWGDELADRTAHAWPYLIGKLFKQEVSNMATPGASNDRILRIAVEESIKQVYDLVIVVWADHNRFETWSDPDQQVKCINVHNDFLPWISDYYKFSYNDLYNLEKKSLQILLLQQHFKMINQPYFFANVSGRHISYRSNVDKLGYIWKEYDLTWFMGWYDGGLVEWAHDAPRGPSGHPLELGHQRIAEQVAKYISIYKRLQ